MKTKNFILALLTLLASSEVRAFDFWKSGFYYNINSNGTSVTVTHQGDWENGGSYSGDVIIIPSTVTYNDVVYEVTSIGSYAFWDCSGLTSISIPNSVTSIGERAFEGCYNLSNITIPNSVSSIGCYAFNTTKWYSNNSNGLVYAGKVAYKYKETMPSGTIITLEEGTKGIAGEAFSGCSGLTSITIPNSVTSIGNNAFKDCSNLIRVDNFSITPQSISSGTFSNRANATLNVPKGSKAAYEAASYWNEFKEIEELPVVSFADGNVKALCVANWDTNGNGELEVAEAAAVTSIGSVFSSNTSISSFDEFQYFTGLTTINDYAFLNCTGLTSITIPESVTRIGSYAFQRNGLTSIKIPESVTSISYAAFLSCSSLTRAEFASIESLCNISFGDSSSNPLYYAHHLYINGVEAKDVVIPESVTNISIYTFSGCTGLTSLSVESGNTKYDSRNNCNAIIETETNTLVRGYENTVIPNNVTSIGTLAFDGCSGLTSITIPENVTSIGNFAFQSCDGFQFVTIPESVTSFGNYIFNACSNLSVTLNSSDIVSKTYSSSSNLGKIFGSHVAEYIIAEGVTSIGDYAFYGCSGLTSITIPNSVTGIGNNAFRSCSSLTSIDIPNSVTSIGNYAFDSCSSLTSLTIGSDVTSIGTYAFYYCSALTRVDNLSGTPQNIASSVFSHRGNATLYVPAGSKAAYEAADYWKGFKEIVEFGGVSSTDITLDQSTLSFNAANQTVTLTATVTPANATNKSVTWASSNTAVATVSNAGVVTAVADGTATITATTADGTNLSATCQVTVNIIPLITFADDAVKALCVANWDTNGDGELNEAEAAAVTDLGTVFKENTTISSFNELQYFTGLTNIVGLAFYGCTGLTSITIPSSITSIGNKAFYNCPNLTSVNIPDGVTAIDERAFWNCSSLTSVTIPESVTTIGLNAFGDCTGLTKAEFSSIEHLCSISFGSGSANPLMGGHHLYINGQEVTEVVIPDGVTAIGNCVFHSASYITSVTIPSSVTSIGSYAFEACRRLTEIVIPNSVNTIGQRTFQYCSNLTSVTMPASVINFTGDFAFGENNIIESVYITDLSKWLQTDFNNGNNPLRSGARLYLNNEEVKNLVIPEGTTSILTAAFEGCESLTSVVIPSCVTAINPYAFSSCPNLKAMVVNNTTPMSISTPQSLGTIFVPNESVDVYKAAEGWSTFADHIQPWTGWTFDAPVPCGEGTANLTFKVTSANPWEVEVSASPEDIAGALTIPATVQDENGFVFAVKAICGDAFLRRHSLTSVVLPEGLTCILDRAFNECENLERVILPSSLKDIYQGAFMNCTSLSSITLPDGLTKISLATFQNTPSLKSINLPEGIITIEHDAFRDSGLESISFPSTLTEVGESAFHSCHQLTNIDFNGCSAVFAGNAFAWCESLEEVYIPNTVTLGGYFTFACCASLREVVFEEGNPTRGIFSTFIGDYTSSSLETVVLPSFEFMDTGCFSNCTNLKSVTFLSGSPNNKSQHISKNFFNVPDDVLFTIPEGTAESYLRAGYKNLSDKGGLPFVREEFEAEAARITTMADALPDGDKTSLNNSISEARTIVNATDDYMMVYAQIAAIKTSASTFLSIATLPEGFDITAASITNPDIERYPIGWNIGDFSKSQGYQPASYSNGDITISSFIDAWSPGHLDNGQIAQTIIKLPAGIYRLEADLIATNQNDASAEVTGVNLFAGNKSIAVATENQKPQHFSFKFENTLTKDVTIGININGTNANWVAMDNVRLIYEGKAADIPQGIDLASDENARVYLYNVETGKYLSAGHSYGTHAMLDETGLPVRLTQDAETGLWQVYFWEGSKSDQLLFSHYSSEKREEVYVDYDHSRSDADDDLTLWRITQTGDGNYLIQNKKYLDTEFYLGNIPTRQDAQLNYNGISYTDIISKASVNDNSHWLIFTKENSDQLSAKHRLMAAIMRMEASDNVNDELLAAAQTVYNNADATAVEVIDITTQLNSQMGMPAENQPVDMTALIINPRFENNTTEGWSGANAVGGRADATSNHEQEFYEKDFNMYQTITGVPNGRYMLKWKGFHRPGPDGSNWDTYTAGTDNASAVVYANEVEHTMLNHASSGGSPQVLVNTDNEYQYGGNWYPHTMETARAYFDAGYYIDQLEVVVTDNVLTIGVKNTQEMGSKHWVVFSDFELYIMENAEQLNNRLVASSAKGLSGGKATLPINMTNQDAIAGIQFKVKLPEGMTLNTNANGTLKVSKTTRTNALNTLSASDRGDYYQVLAYGIDQSVAPGTGAIAKLELNIAEELGLGEYEVEIYDVVLSNMAGLRIRPFSTQSIVTLVDAEVGDANHDGEVDVADIIAIANHILGTTPDKFDETAANVNGDEDIDVADIIGVANIILNGKPSSVKARYAERRETDYLDPQ